MPNLRYGTLPVYTQKHSHRDKGSSRGWHPLRRMLHTACSLFYLFPQSKLLNGANPEKSILRQPIYCQTPEPSLYPG